MPIQAKLLVAVEKCFVVIAIIIYSRAFVFHLFTDLNRGSDSSIDLKTDGPVVANNTDLLVVYIIIYCITALLAMKRWRELLQYLRQEKFIVLLLALAGMSATWSVAPGTTLARSVALGGTTLFGLYWAARFTLDQQLKSLAIAFYVIIFSSFLAALLYPQLGTMQGDHQGLWQGVFSHKNLLGRMIILGSIVFFLLAANNTRRRYLYWLGFWSALLLLLMSSSKSSFLSYILLFTGVAAYLAIVKNYRLSFVAFLSVSIVSACLVLIVKYSILPPIVLSKFGSNCLETTNCIESIIAAAPPSASPESLETGTGRTPLWALLWNKVQLKPMFGYGYGGFWLGKNGPSVELPELIREWARNAHNGFLDLILDLGLVGLALFLTGYTVAFWKALAHLSSGQFDPLKLYFPMVLAYILLANIGASDLLVPNFLFWICIVSASCYYARNLSNARQGAN